MSDLLQLAHLNLLDFDREQTRWGDPHQIVERDGVLLFAPATPFAFLLNGAHRVDPEVPAEHVLAAAEAFFGDLGRTYTMRPADHEPDIAEACAASADYTEFGGGPEMICPDRLDDLPTPGDVDLAWADTAADIETFTGICGRAYATYGMPEDLFGAMVTHPERVLANMGTVIARVDGEPAACAQYLLSHGIAGVYWVATVPEARGRGLGELVTNVVTNRAFDLGAGAVTLQASPMGEAVYDRMGYETVYQYTNFLWQPGG